MQPAKAWENCTESEPAFDPGSMTLARVTAKRAYFHDEAKARLKAFVVKDDVVMADKTGNGFVCAWFINNKGVSTLGYVKASDIAALPPENAPLEAWLGDWTTGAYQNLTIKTGSKPGWLAVEGAAYWANSEEAALSGGLHEGGVGGEGPVENGVIGFTQTEDGSYEPYSETARDRYICAIQLRLIGRSYLEVVDSVSCGGANVSFIGTYARGKVEFEP